MLDVKQIMDILPHRFPFLMVDRILEIEPGERAVGMKNVTINEPFFQGHWPNNPVMPGVLVLEAMAQVGGTPLNSRCSAGSPKRGSGSRYIQATNCGWRWRWSDAGATSVR